MSKQAAVLEPRVELSTPGLGVRVATMTTEVSGVKLATKVIDDPTIEIWAMIGRKKTLLWALEI